VIASPIKGHDPYTSSHLGPQHEDESERITAAQKACGWKQGKLGIGRTLRVS
jgi:hypothetical protein